MVEDAELAETLSDVGIKENDIKKVLTVGKKMEIDSPQRLYQILNLSNVTGAKTVARALIAVFGEDGRKFMKGKLDEGSNTTRATNKQQWNEEVSGMELDKTMNDMAKAIRMKMMMNLAGMGNNNNGGQNVPMAEEPMMKEGKFVLDDNNNMVMRRVPASTGGGMSEAMMTLLGKMMEMNQNSGQQNMQAFTELFKVVATENLKNDNDKLLELEREIANTKEELTKKELEMRDDRIRGVLGDLADELEKTKRMAGRDPVEDVQRVKKQAEALKEVGAFGNNQEDSESWKRRIEEENMKRQHEIQRKGLETLERVGKSIGKPIAGAVGQGVKESMVRKAGQTSDDKVNDMLNKVQEQKQRATEQTEKPDAMDKAEEIIQKSQGDYDKSLDEIEVN